MGDAPIQPQTPAIAVVGMACRLPGSNNSIHAFWNFLKQARQASNTVPESRFNVGAHADGSGKPKTMTSVPGMFLEDIDIGAFDAGFFNISPAEAMAMDPQQRQLLEVAYECLENSGISVDAIFGREMGCFVGSFVGGADENPSVQTTRREEKIDQYARLR
ncbi:hypothetical protein PCG10_008375 [Penicillium crustosum]|uniref:Ketosynthase family 3 (KS3) domain-containing protein n=1 Tax=Penicillium crustosum TaxID=36656 RepID=A0A9P5KYJ6_PENCR|nr:hypothetical protein PCG10_008375 [Penicillium crustosum]